MQELTPQQFHAWLAALLARHKGLKDGKPEVIVTTRGGK